MDKKKLEQYITRKYIKKPYKRIRKNKNFARGLLISLDKPRDEAERILFNMISKYN